LNTFQNSASVLSIGFFFTVITLGLAASLPHTLLSGLSAQGVPVAQATAISHIPAIGSLFSAFLGVNPMKQLLGAHLLAQSGVHASALLGRGFFPNLIEAPFAKGLHMAFLVAAGLCFVGAVFSWMRGAGGVHLERAVPEEDEEGFAGVGQGIMSEVGVGSPGAVLLPEGETGDEKQ
jgi:hypothetical protein